MGSAGVWTFGLDEIERVASEVIAALGDARIVLLEGEMGAGKTTLTQALVRALGSTDVVTSPTYTLSNEYHSPFGPVYHWDLYRLTTPTELEAIGFAEYLDSGNWCLIEWPELAIPFLPATGVARLEIKPLDGGLQRSLSLFL
jgi:tRNA threonylcarbamoyladenosine biosynthesis protein TsaE